MFPERILSGCTVNSAVAGGRPPEGRSFRMPWEPTYKQLPERKRISFFSNRKGPGGDDPEKGEDVEEKRKTRQKYRIWKIRWVRLSVVFYRVISPIQVGGTTPGWGTVQRGG